MEKARLLELVKQHDDKEAIGMILSNFTDYGHTEKGGMISVGQFYKVAECLIEWWGGKSKTSEPYTEALRLQNAMPCFSDEQITDKAIVYAKDFKIWGSELETAKVQSNAVRDYYNGYKDALNKA